VVQTRISCPSDSDAPHPDVRAEQFGHCKADEVDGGREGVAEAITNGKQSNKRQEEDRIYNGSNKKRDCRQQDAYRPVRRESVQVPITNWAQGGEGSGGRCMARCAGGELGRDCCCWQNLAESDS